MNEIIYAPVVIPTLNRFEHFKRCIESLEKCTGAEHTEVFVGLDYPPSDRYRKGWEQIGEYLSFKEKQNGFKKLHIIRRNHNYGVGKRGSNMEMLINDISKVFDCYILTEDDNEFSPCFLQYMNKALEKFYDDDRIFLVCGYNYKMTFPEMYRNSYYISKHGCPWGTGEWFHKRKDYQELYDLDVLKKILKDDTTYHTLMKRSPHVIHSIISQLKNGVLWGDAIKGLYVALKDKYCIMPRVSMVRNWGNDGTGEHSKRMNNEQNDFYTTQPISNELYFEFTDDIFTYEPVFLERHHYSQKKNLYVSLRKLHSDLKFKLDIFLFRKFNYLPKSRWI